MIQPHVSPALLVLVSRRHAIGCLRGGCTLAPGETYRGTPNIMQYLPHPEELPGGGCSNVWVVRSALGTFQL
ncbi:hypothetical protein NDU88_008936 [Pleurodeles waltl]|uniref:Secreted protein n=1 Tax=Pleurodeles waltl TaxID=8319 RepID=A0AAV7RX61_PLEWA|nr:hypothetical protein NDU88_008936 [Pleurodeles waltl]